LGNNALRKGQPQEGLAMVEEALAIYRELGNRFAAADALSGIGSAYRLVGDGDAACDAHRQALEIFVEVGNPTGIAMVLEEMAMVETMDGRHERALRLAAAAASLKEETGGGAPEELMKAEEGLQASRRSLDAETAERAWQEGREMGTDKAIAYALNGSSD
jgi:tetratricopeptide (TPR) repeat protein